MKQFDCLANSDYISPQKSGGSTECYRHGPIATRAGGPEVQPATAPPKGTDS